MEEKNEVVKEKKKLTDKQKEIIITVVVLIFSIALGLFLGKLLYDAVYGGI